MSTFTGLIPPICTPLTDTREIDVTSLNEIIEFQISQGASGIFVLGSSGEAIYLDDEQRRLVATAASRAVAGRVPLLLGALAPTARRVRQQIDLLAPVKADGFVLTAPFYAALSAAEIVEHFRYVAKYATLPVIAYDIPGNVGAKLENPVLATLLREGTVVGLKDSSGDVDAFRALAEELGTDRKCSLLSGADTKALDALDAGADGMVPGLSNIRPDLFLRLQEAHRAGNGAAARVLQDGIITLNGIFRIGQAHGLGRHASEIGALKHVLHERGVIATTRLPQPLSDYPDEARDDASALMNKVDRQVAEGLAALEPEGATRG